MELFRVNCAHSYKLNTTVLCFCSFSAHKRNLKPILHVHSLSCRGSILIFVALSGLQLFIYIILQQIYRMEIPISTVVSTQPFFIDRKTRPTIFHHSRNKSTPISPLKKYCQTPRLQGRLSMIKEYNYQISQELRSKLKQLRNSERKTFNEEFERIKQRNRKFHTQIKQAIKKALLKIFERNRSLYHQLKHICWKQKEKENIFNQFYGQERRKQKYFDISLEQKFLQFLTNKLKENFDEQQKNLIENNNQNEQVSITERRNRQRTFRKGQTILNLITKKKISEESRNSLEQLILLKRKDTKRSTKFIRKNETRNKQLQIEDRESIKTKKSTKKEMSMKNIDNNSKMVQTKKEIDGVEKMKSSQKKPRKSQEFRQQHSQMVKSKKDFRKNDKKIKIVTEKDNKPLTRRKNLDKKTQQIVLSLVEFRKKKATKTKLINKGNNKYHLQNSLEQEQQQQEVKIQQLEPQIQEDKIISKSFMTKYEEQKLLFDLIKKKKNASIKKCKLNPDYSINSDDSNDYDEKQHSGEVKKAKKVKKKIPKAFLKKESHLLSQFSDQLNSSSQKEEQNQEQGQKTGNNTLWDDLLFKIMEKKTSYDLFSLKDSIEQKLKKCNNPKAKQLHQFNYYLKKALKAKLQQVQESWLGNYKDGSEIDEIESFVDKLPLKSEELQKPFIVERSVNKNICNYYSGNIINFQNIMEDIDEASREDDLEQISLKDICYC